MHSTERILAMIRLPLVIIVVVTATSCASVSITDINRPYDKDPDISADDMSVILDDWFECDECVNGQLRRVQELGNSAVSALGDAYSGVALPSLVLDKAIVFEERCERINTLIVARDFDAQNCALYKARFQKNLERRYQRRAFRALVAIRTSDSCAIIGGDERCKSFDAFRPYQVEITTGRSVRIFD